MSQTTKSTLLRFLRGFVGGATGTMLTLGVFGGASLVDLRSWLVMLGISGIAGGIGGLLLALDKWARMPDPSLPQ